MVTRQMFAAPAAGEIVAEAGCRWARALSSAAVAVTAVPPILGVVMSSVSILLLESSTTAFEAAAVPAVMPSRNPSSVVLRFVSAFNSPAMSLPLES
jgi:hypothetical protein